MFAEFLKQNSYEIEFERLGIRTAIEPLSEDELEECRRMKGSDGARYALYIACPALHEEGERLYKEGAIFSPLDITHAVDLADINSAYRYIKEISGVGNERVRFYKNEMPAEYGADEAFDVIDGTLDDDGDVRFDNGAAESVQNVSENAVKGQEMTKSVTNGRIMAEGGTDVDKIAQVLAMKLRLAAENM